MAFIDFIVQRCLLSDNSYLLKVGETFNKWEYDIAAAISRSQNQNHTSNSAAENTNNHIEAMIRVSYGFHNFQRFIKRVLLVRTYKKK